MMRGSPTIKSSAISMFSNIKSAGGSSSNLFRYTIKKDNKPSGRSS